MHQGLSRALFFCVQMFLSTTGSGAMGKGSEDSHACVFGLCWGPGPRRRMSEAAARRYLGRIRDFVRRPLPKRVGLSSGKSPLSCGVIPMLEKRARSLWQEGTGSAPNDPRATKNSGPRGAC